MVIDSIRPKIYNRILRAEPNNFVGYWPMSEGSGGVGVDASPKGNDGAYTGVTLGQPGIGDGRLCPLFDGVNDFNNIYSVGLNGDFNGREGTLFLYGRPLNAGVWTDGQSRVLARCLVNGTNYLDVRSDGGGNVVARYQSQGVGLRTDIQAMSSADWFNYIMTWSVVDDEVRYFLDGVALPIDNALGAWAGNLSATQTVIGAASTAPLERWSGYIAHCMILNIALPPAKIPNLMDL